MEILIKTTCGGGPKPPLSSSGGDSGSNEDFDSGFDRGD